MAQTQLNDSKNTTKNMWNFYKGRNMATHVLSSLIKRHESHADHWQPQIKLLQHLKWFPTSSIELRGIDTGAKSKLLKWHLTELFPETKIKVKLTRLVSLSTILVTVEGGKTPDGLRDICDIYQDKGQTNPSTSSFDWDNIVKIDVSKMEKETYITAEWSEK